MKFIKVLFILLLIQGCNDTQSKMLFNGSNVKAALHELKIQKKFVKDLTLLYFGAPDEATRIKAQKIINSALDKFIKTPPNGLTVKIFWSTLETAAKQLGQMDSDEMERGLSYMEEIMDIYKIDSSEGRLNEWRYGFNPNAN